MLCSDDLVIQYLHQIIKFCHLQPFLQSIGDRFHLELLHQRIFVTLPELRLFLEYVIHKTVSKLSTFMVRFSHETLQGLFREAFKKCYFFQQIKII